MAEDDAKRPDLEPIICEMQRHIMALEKEVVVLKELVRVAAYSDASSASVTLRDLIAELEDAGFKNIDHNLRQRISLCVQLLKEARTNWASPYRHDCLIEELERVGVWEHEDDDWS